MVSLSTGASRSLATVATQTPWKIARRAFTLAAGALRGSGSL